MDRDNELHPLRFFQLLRDVFDLFTEFYVTDKPVAVAPRPNHSQRESAQGPKLNPPGGLAGILGADGCEPVDFVTMSLGFVDAKHTHAVRSVEVEMGDPVVLAHTLEQGFGSCQKRLGVTGGKGRPE